MMLVKEVGLLQGHQFMKSESPGMAGLHDCLVKAWMAHHALPDDQCHVALAAHVIIAKDTC